MFIRNARLHVRMCALALITTSLPAQQANVLATHKPIPRAIAQTTRPQTGIFTDPDLHFPKTFSSDLPYDVDPYALAAALAQDLRTAASQRPSEEMRVPRSQRLFDIFAWRAFLALNWPADASGNPERDRTLADPGPRVWEFWIEPSHVFKLDGADPDPWPTTLAEARTPLARTKAAWTTTVRTDQNLQAFSGPPGGSKREMGSVFK
jgi:hypothetical protein